MTDCTGGCRCDMWCHQWRQSWHQDDSPWIHDDVIKWKHFPRYWPFVRGIHRSPVNSPHKGQWRGALMFTLICARINGEVNNCKAGDLKRNRAHYDVIVMFSQICWLLVIMSSPNLNSFCSEIDLCLLIKTFVICHVFLSEWVSDKV